MRRLGLILLIIPGAYMALTGFAEIVIGVFAHTDLARKLGTIVGALVLAFLGLKIIQFVVKHWNTKPTQTPYKSEVL